MKMIELSMNILTSPNIKKFDSSKKSSPIVPVDSCPKLATLEIFRYSGCAMKVIDL